MILLREYKENEIMEIHDRFHNGGKLWVFERTDTNQFYHEPIQSVTFHEKFRIEWVNEINDFIITSAFLSKEDAEKCMHEFREGMQLLW